MKNKLNNKQNPIWLDIETGGVESRNSSILSIAAGTSDSLKESFIKPEVGTYLSKFSEETIIPQLQGKKLLSEKQGILNFIQQLEQSPTSPLTGFNIRGFDIGFISNRARQYGLEKRFTETVRKRKIVDPSYRIKDLIASEISQHIDAGTFDSELGSSFTDALSKHSEYKTRPRELNTLAQVKGYLRATDRERAQFKGWKLTDINSILDMHEGKQEFAGAAHEAATDILMTERASKAFQSGTLKQALQKPDIAKHWLSTVSSRIPIDKTDPGKLVTDDLIKQLIQPVSNTSTTTSKAGNLLPSTGISKYINKYTVGIGIGVGLVSYNSIFSAKDDNYNTIEGLDHKGIAQQGRLELTEFGSGYKGPKGRTLVGGGLAVLGGAYLIGGLNNAHNKKEEDSSGIISTVLKGALALKVASTVAPFIPNALKQIEKTKNLTGLNRIKTITTETVKDTLEDSKEYFEQYLNILGNKDLSKLGKENILRNPELATKTDRALYVSKYFAGKAEKAVEHIVGWLNKNWIPDLKGQGSITDTIGAYTLLAGGLHSGYESAKSAYEGDVSGAAGHALMFAAEKYMYMGFKNRSSIKNIINNIDKSDMSNLAGLAGSALKVSQNAVAESTMGSLAFIATGIDAKSWAKLRVQTSGPALQKSLNQEVSYVSAIHQNLQPSTKKVVAIKKLNQSQVQQIASSKAWKAGANGGRISKS